MRRPGALFIGMIVLLCGLLLCGAGAPRGAVMDPPPPDTAETPVPQTVTLSQPAAGWQDSYAQFMQANYDIFMALWPDGISGVGFVDLDLDGTPEMVTFDQGASASLGAQIFDLVNGQVYCVSSTNNSASGAFDESHLSSVDVCTSTFESFRLSRTNVGWCFWVDSSNGTMETAWDEIVRFDCVDGFLTPVTVCYRYLEFDPNSGVVVKEDYTVNGMAADVNAYQAAANVYQEGQDTGYDAKGVFFWNDYNRYGTTLDGFMNMVRDALSAYAPITENITLASPAA